MFVTIENQKLSIDQVKEPKYSKNFLSKDVSKTIDIIKSWESGQEHFAFKTSGSTGTPRSISLSRKALNYSAEQTLNYLNLNRKDLSEKNMLLALSPSTIGGAMVIIRALISNASLIYNEPSSKINISENVVLTSLVPLQIQKLLTMNQRIFDLIENVLIGGAHLDPELENRLINIKGTNFYHTYGMTETASHIAIRKVGENKFHLLGDVEIGQNDKDCLILKGTVTEGKWISTNDIVEINQDGFIWRGRKDFIINSGGIKMNPENLEKRLASQFKEPFIITSIPDKGLENKLVLVAEEPEFKINFESLSKYEIPKEIFFGIQLERTTSGKIDRINSRKNLLENDNF